MRWVRTLLSKQLKARKLLSSQWQGLGYRPGCQDLYCSKFQVIKALPHLLPFFVRWRIIGKSYLAWEWMRSQHFQDMLLGLCECNWVYTMVKIIPS